jgi:hypothetical protein
VPSAAFARGQEGGAEACDIELKQVEGFVSQRQSQLSPEQRRDAARRLDVARSQCVDQAHMGLTALDSLRHDVGMEAAASVAQVPSEGGLDR